MLLGCCESCRRRHETYVAAKSERVVVTAQEACKGLSSTNSKVTLLLLELSDGLATAAGNKLAYPATLALILRKATSTIMHHASTARQCPQVPVSIPAACPESFWEATPIDECFNYSSICIFLTTRQSNQVVAFPHGVANLTFHDSAVGFPPQTVIKTSEVKQNTGYFVGMQPQ